MKLFVKWMLFVMMIVCMSGIFMFSSQTGEQSNNISGTLTEKIAESDLSGDRIGESYEERDRFNTALRKYAHFMMFFVLGLLAAAFAQLAFAKLYTRLGYPLGVSLVWALVDEVHQMYVPGRTGQPMDVLIDFIGALLATAVVAAIAWAVRRKKV